MLRLLALAFFLLPAAASAYVEVESVSGEVTGGEYSKFSLKSKNRIFYRDYPVSTGAGAQAVLRFDDGMRVLLHENTTIVLRTFVYSTTERTTNRALIDLTRGSVRIVTGYIADQNPQAGVTLRAPHATLVPRGGADFVATIVNPLYVSVKSGLVAASNSAASVTFAAGTAGSVAGASAAPTAISAASLPAQAGTALTQMNAVAIAGAGSQAAGLSVTAAGLSSTAVVTTVVIGAAVIAGVAAAASDDDDTAQPAATTHH